MLCRDNTKAEDVAGVKNNQKAILFESDLPYLVSYDGTNHPSKQGRPDKKQGLVGKLRHHLDDASQGPELYEGFITAIEHAILPNAAWYCWHASRRQAMVESVWEKFCAFVHQQIVWAQDRGIKGEICCEPFSGSGSQIIAGEATGRRVYAIEISPQYVDVAGHVREHSRNLPRPVALSNLAGLPGP